MTTRVELSHTIKDFESEQYHLRQLKEAGFVVFDGEIEELNTVIKNYFILLLYMTSIKKELVINFYWWNNTSSITFVVKYVSPEVVPNLGSTCYIITSSNYVMVK